MSGDRRYEPNRQLAWERLERGWSHDEVARQVDKSLNRAGEVGTGLAGNTVRRWEAGERWPEPRYRKHLVQVFGKTASELGLLSPEELTTRPTDEDVTAVVQRVVDIIKPSSTATVLTRQTFLKGVLGAGLVTVLAPIQTSIEAVQVLGHAIEHGAGPSGEDVAAYTQITTAQRSLYWTSSAPVLFEAALAHTQLGVQMMRAADAPTRYLLAPALAETALTAGRLAFFDLRQAATAQQCFNLALSAAREADDHALAAGVIGHMSFIPGFARDPRTALALIEQAQNHARRRTGPLLRSWLECVAAEVTAKNDDPKASLGHIRRAEHTITMGGSDPPWLDYYDRSRMHSFAGYTLLVAGHPEAATTLEASLAGLDERSTKQRGIVLLDLATVRAKQDAQEGVRLALEAIELLAVDWYGMAHDRLPALEVALAGTREAATIEERIRALTATWLYPAA